MFNLEQSVAGWRRQMQTAGIKTPLPLEELEIHLREDIEQQIRAGLSVQRAFEAAVQRIGQARALEAEFAKTAEPKEARERKLKLLCIVFTVLGYLTPLALNVPKPWSGMSVTERWLGLAAVALTVLSPFSGLYLHRFLPIIPDKRIRTCVQFTLSLPVVIWLCVFTFVILPRLDLTLGQVTLAMLWALSPLAVFGGLIFGLDEAARRGTTTAAS